MNLLAKAYQLLDRTESKLNTFFNHTVGYSLPKKGRARLGHAFWWIALLLGILQLLAFRELWQLGRATNNFVDWANSYATQYGAVRSDHLGVLFYLSLIVLLADALLLLLAVPALKRMQKRRGWNFLYYSLLINVGYGFIRTFALHDGANAFITSLLASLISGYFLFQVRNHFSVHKSTTTNKDEP